MTTRRTPAVLLVVSALVLAASVVAPSASGALRTTASIRVSQPRPVANEQFVVSGRVSTRFRRAVTLRVKTAGRAWRPLRRGTFNLECDRSVNLGEPAQVRREHDVDHGSV